jgi:hypothetical protein
MPLKADSLMRTGICRSRRHSLSTHDYCFERPQIASVCNEVQDTIVRFDDNRNVSEGDWVVARTPGESAFAHLRVEIANDGPAWAALEYIDSFGGNCAIQSVDELLEMLNRDSADEITRESTVRVINFSVETVISHE